MDSSSKQQTSAPKNWLIRTKQRQILGPVSKEKLISFVEKGALGPEDEVMSGNGYWFALQEKELLDKYVLGDIPQSFDPISEAKSVLSVSQERREGTSSLHPNPDPLKWEKEQIAKQEKANEPPEEDLRVPDEDDLAYPDLGEVGGDEEALPDQGDLEYPDFGDLPSDSSDEPQTQVLKLDNTLAQKQAPEEDRSSLVEEVEDDESAEDDWDGHLPPQDDLEYPDLGESNFSEPEPEPEPEAESEPEKKKSVAPPGKPVEKAAGPVKKKDMKASKKKKKVIEAPKRNDRYLFYILALVVLLTLGVFYYYRKILNKPLPLIGAVISDVQAQSLVQDPSGLKKKESLSPCLYQSNFTGPRSSSGPRELV